jgi:hypothetical protein
MHRENALRRPMRRMRNKGPSTPKTDSLRESVSSAQDDKFLRMTGRSYVVLGTRYSVLSTRYFTSPANTLPYTLNNFAHTA